MISKSISDQYWRIYRKISFSSIFHLLQILSICKIIPACISAHQKTELHKSSQSLICQVTQDHPGKISLYIPPNPKYSSHCIGKSRQMIGLESDKNYSIGHFINGNLAEKKLTGRETC